MATSDTKAILGAELQSVCNQVATEINKKQDTLTEMTADEVQAVIDNIGSLT